MLKPLYSLTSLSSKHFSHTCSYSSLSFSLAFFFLLNNYLTNKSKSYLFITLPLSLSHRNALLSFLLSSLFLTPKTEKNDRARLFGLFAFDTNQQQGKQNICFFFLLLQYFAGFLTLFAFISTCFRVSLKYGMNCLLCLVTLFLSFSFSFCL